MKFPANIYLLSFLGAFGVSVAALPFWRALCRRCGLVDDPGQRKIHDEPIPLAGGFSVLSGMVFPLLVALAVVHWNFPGFDLAGKLKYGFGRRGLELEAIVAGAFIVVLIGGLDDRFELKPAVKFCGQFAAALLVAWSGVRITLFVPSAAFSYGITILWFLTVINALNFMDNMNGLCAGVGAIGAAAFAIMAAVMGQYLVAMIGLLACGALLGFLPYNYPKASAFLGDTGSHLVGYLLAVMAVLPHFYTAKQPRVWAVFLPLLVLAVPLADLAWVVVLRWRLGKPFYVGDTNHVSHRLVRAGWGKPAAVAWIWLAAAGAGGAAVGLLLISG